MKHTQGQWKVNINNNIVITDESGINKFIAQTEPCGQAEANSKLIAAAPELLECCDAVLTAWHNNPSDMYKKEPAYLEQIRKAIKKATE
jgi:hypothetical protein